jgi:hypothetical protein
MWILSNSLLPSARIYITRCYKAISRQNIAYYIYKQTLQFIREEILLYRIRSGLPSLNV